MAVDKAALLDNTRLLPHDDVEVPGVGTVRVRGLSRAEVLEMQSCTDAGDMETRLMVAGLVEPALSLEEVTKWRSQAASTEVMPVSDRILELSGLVEGQQTEKERRFRSGDE